VIQYFTTLTSVANQSGVMGTWNNPKPGYEVVSGTLTAAEKAELDEEIAFFILMMSEIATEITYYVSSTQIIISIPEDINSTFSFFAEDFNDDYYRDSQDAAQADIIVETINSATVRLTGGTTGEIVTITVNNQGDRIYTSTDPTHASHTYYQEPVSCPNNTRPDWILEFYTDNGRENPPNYYKKMVQKKSAKTGISVLGVKWRSP